VFDPVYRARTDTLKASDNPLARGVAVIDGAFVPLDEARIPLMDQGFLLVRWDGDVLETAHYSELEKVSA